MKCCRAPFIAMDTLTSILELKANTLYHLFAILLFLSFIIMAVYYLFNSFGITRELNRTFWYYTDDYILRVWRALEVIVVLSILFLGLPSAFYNTFLAKLDFPALVKVSQLFSGSIDLPLIGSVRPGNILFEVFFTGVALESLLQPRCIISFSRFVVITDRTIVGESCAQDVLRIRYWVRLPSSEQLNDVALDVMIQTPAQKKNEDPNEPWLFRYKVPSRKGEPDSYFGIRGVFFIDIPLHEIGYESKKSLLGALRNDDWTLTVRAIGQTQAGGAVCAQKQYSMGDVLDGYDFKSINGRDETADNRGTHEFECMAYFDLLYKTKSAGVEGLCLGVPQDRYVLRKDQSAGFCRKVGHLLMHDPLLASETRTALVLLSVVLMATSFIT